MVDVYYQKKDFWNYLVCLFFKQFGLKSGHVYRSLQDLYCAL